MMDSIPVFVALVLSYLLGALPTAYLLVRWTRRVDIRAVGSGNVGATNALRAAGSGVGAAVFVIDVLKGVAAARLVPAWTFGLQDPLLSFICGFMAVVGHDFPCFLNFQGGKGVATAVGVLLGAMPTVAGIVIAVWLAAITVTRYVSISSMVAAAVIPVAQAWTGQSRLAVFLGGLLAWLVLLRHSSNVERLRQGTEHRVGLSGPR